MEEKKKDPIKRNYLPSFKIKKIKKFSWKNMLFNLKNRYDIKLVVEMNLKDIGMLQELRKDIFYKLSPDYKRGSENEVKDQINFKENPIIISATNEKPIIQKLDEIGLKHHGEGFGVQVEGAYNE